MGIVGKYVDHEEYMAYIYPLVRSLFGSAVVDEAKLRRRLGDEAFEKYVGGLAEHMIAVAGS